MEEEVSKHDRESSTIYIGRIPDGFYEHQMHVFFSQFGEIKRLKLARSKKTGGSKHFGFVQFEEVEVANIVCETMNNYILMGHVLQCKIVPAEKVTYKLFSGTKNLLNKIKLKKIIKRHTNPDKISERQKRLVAKQKSKMRKLEDLGVAYSFPGYESQKRRNNLIDSDSRKTKRQRGNEESNKIIDGDNIIIDSSSISPKTDSKSVSNSKPNKFIRRKSTSRTDSPNDHKKKKETVNSDFSDVRSPVKKYIETGHIEKTSEQSHIHCKDDSHSRSNTPLKNENRSKSNTPLKNENKSKSNTPLKNENGSKSKSNTPLKNENGSKSKSNTPLTKENKSKSNTPNKTDKSLNSPDNKKGTDSINLDTKSNTNTPNSMRRKSAGSSGDINQHIDVSTPNRRLSADAANDHIRGSAKKMINTPDKHGEVNNERRKSLQNSANKKK